MERLFTEGKILLPAGAGNGSARRSLTRCKRATQKNPNPKAHSLPACFMANFPLLTRAQSTTPRERSTALTQRVEISKSCMGARSTWRYQPCSWHHLSHPDQAAASLGSPSQWLPQVVGSSWSPSALFQPPPCQDLVVSPRGAEHREGRVCGECASRQEARAYGDCSWRHQKPQPLISINNFSREAFDGCFFLSPQRNNNNNKKRENERKKEMKERQKNKGFIKCQPS